MFILGLPGGSQSHDYWYKTSERNGSEGVFAAMNQYGEIHRRAIWHMLVRSPEWAYIVIALISGTLYMLATPPFMGFDEHAHFFRAYQVAEGHFLAERQQQPLLGGGNLPASLNRFVEELWPNTVIQGKQTIEQVMATAGLPLEPEQRQFIDFRGATFYTPVPYLGHALGIALGQIVAPTPLGIFMLGRLFGLLSAVALTFLAIRLIPFGKWILFLVTLTPTAVFQMGVFSADGFTNSIAFLWIALLLAYAFAPQYSQLTLCHVAVLVLVSALLTLSKQPYFVLLLLYLLIPVRRLGEYRVYWLTFIGLGVLNLALLGLWTLLVQNHIYVPRLPENPDIVPRNQVLFILNHPWRFVLAQMTNISMYNGFTLRQLLGQMGYHALLWLPLTVIHALLLVGTALLDGHAQIQSTLRQRLVLLLTFVLGWVGIHAIAYIGWNAVGAPFISGVQPRYLLPLLPLPFLFLAMWLEGRPLWRERVVWLLPFYALIAGIVGTWQIFQQYYE
jgi:uncharacterized membrane protein